MREGWEYKKLGEVCHSKNDIEKAAKVFAPSDEILYIDISSIDNLCFQLTDLSKYILSEAPSRAQQKVERNDIIISTVRPNLKNIAVVDRKENNIVASSGFCILRTLEQVDKKYIFHYITSNLFTAHLMRLTTGANYPAVKDSDIRNSIIPIPPLSEQEAIVAELDKINELINLKKTQLKDLDNLAQSIFYEMFGDPVENEKGWEVKKLYEVLSLFAGGDVPKENFSKTKTDYYNVPIYSNGVDEKGLYGYTNSARVKEKCITIAGRGTIGTVFLRDHPFYPIIRLITAIPNIPMEVDYLKFYAENMNFKGKGGTIPQLTIPMIKNSFIPLPPLSLQQSFASRIELIEQQKAQINATIKDLETLLASRMQYWFD